MGKRSLRQVRPARSTPRQSSPFGVDPLEKRCLFSVINVANYGAVANDGQNDLLAIQAALNASHAGDTILFSGGTFDLFNFGGQQRNSNGNGLIVPGDRIYLGQNGAKIRGKDTKGPVWYIQSYNGAAHAPTNNVTISHMTFEQGGLYIDNVSGMNQNIVLDYNTFNMDMGGENANGLTFKSGLRNSRISNNYFTGYNCSFAIFGLFYNTFTIANNEFVNVRAAVHIDALHNSGSGNLLVEQNYITGAKGMGLEFQSEATNLVFQDNWFEHPNLSSTFNNNNGSMGYSLILDTSTNITIRRNVVIAPERPDGIGSRIGFEVGGDNSLVEDNYVNGINHVLAVNDGVGTCNVMVRNNQFINYLESARISFPSSNPLRTWSNINNGPNTVLSATMRDRIQNMRKPGIGNKRYGDPLPDIDPGGEPTNVPAQPSNLVATVLGAGQVGLSWFDGSFDEDEFEIQMLQDDGTTWQLVATVGANVTTCNISNVPDGRALRVLAHNAGGYSAPSNTATIMSLPGVPQNVVGTAITSNQVDLTWMDTSTNESDFQIQMLSVDGQSWLTIATVAANVTNYSVTGIAAGQTYIFRVVAHNPTGYSQESSTALVMTPLPEVSQTPVRRARPALIYQGNNSTAVTPPIGAS